MVVYAPYVRINAQTPALLRIGFVRNKLLMCMIHKELYRLCHHHHVFSIFIVHTLGQ